MLQAQATAGRFCHLPISAVYSSPLRRAQETAGCIAQATASAVRVDSRLRERANWGDLPGQSFEAFVAMWERCTRDPEYLPPVGDSAKQAGERLNSLLSELAAEHSAESHIVLVTHGGLITDFLVHAFSEEALEVWHPNFVAVQSELIPECSVTTLIYERGTYAIEDFASVDHLKSVR